MVVVDVSRLAVYDLVSIIVLFVVIPQAAIGTDELTDSLILPVVLPVSGLGDAGRRAVFLHNHGDAVAVSKVCDLRIILPTNGHNGSV